jgi:hypothetical protein
MALQHRGKKGKHHSMYIGLKEFITNYRLGPDDDERDFIRRAQAGDHKARDRLVASHMKWATWYGRTINAGIPHKDLEQLSAIAILKAIEDFDLRSNNGLNAYLRGKIWEVVKGAAKAHVKHNGVLSLDAQKSSGSEDDDDGGGETYLDDLTDPPFQGSTNENELECDSQFVERLLSPLSEVERYTVLKRWAGESHKEIASPFGFSDEWSRKNYRAAIKKLNDEFDFVSAADSVLWAKINGADCEQEKRRHDLRLIEGRPCYLPTILNSLPLGPGALRRAQRDFINGFRGYRRGGIGFLRRVPKHHITDIKKLGLGIVRWLPLLPYAAPNWNGELRTSPWTKEEIAAQGRMRAIHDVQIANYALASRDDLRIHKPSKGKSDSALKQPKHAFRNKGFCARFLWEVLPQSPVFTLRHSDHDQFDRDMANRWLAWPEHGYVQRGDKKRWVCALPPEIEKAQCAEQKIFSLTELQTREDEREAERQTDAEILADEKRERLPPVKYKVVANRHYWRDLGSGCKVRHLSMIPAEPKRKPKPKPRLIMRELLESGTKPESLAELPLAA